MKIKKVFITLGLAFATAFGVGAGLRAGNNAKAARAASSGKYTYLVPNSNWKQDNARFAAYFFDSKNDSNKEWADATETTTSGTYMVDVPTGSYDKLIFCRMNPSQVANDWANKWNQTSNLDIKYGQKYTITDGSWDQGTWSDFAPYYTITGDFNNWGDDIMTVSDGVATIEDVAMVRNCGFKIRKNYSWDEQWNATNLNTNDSFTNTNFNGSDNIIAKNAGTYDISLNISTGKITISGEVAPAPTAHTYKLVGTKFGSDWDVSNDDPNVQLAVTNAGRNASITRDFVSGQQFKIALDSSWAGVIGYNAGYTLPNSIEKYGDNNFYVLTSGNYTISIETDENFDTESLTITRNSLLPYRAFSLVGTIFDTEPWDCHHTEYELTSSLDHKSASVEVTTTKQNKLFKIVQDHSWSGAEAYELAADYGWSNLDRPNSQAGYALAQAETNIQLKAVGTYKITVNLNNDFSFKNITVSLGDSELADAVEYATNFNDNNVCGTKDTDGLNEIKWEAEEDAYALLSELVKGFLTNYAGDNAEIVECLERYDRVIFLHGETYDFMGRVAAGKVTPKTTTSLMTYENNNSANVSIILVVISSLVLLSAGGFFFIRKRKEDR